MQFDLLFASVILSIGSKVEKQTSPKPRCEIRTFVFIPVHKFSRRFLGLLSIDGVLKSVRRLLRRLLAALCRRCLSTVLGRTRTLEDRLLRATLPSSEGDHGQE